MTFEILFAVYGVLLRILGQNGNMVNYGRMKRERNGQWKLNWMREKCKQKLRWMSKNYKWFGKKLSSGISRIFTERAGNGSFS